MSDLKSINTLAGNFKKIAELKEYCNKQYETIDLLTKENTSLKEEISHLKSMLVSSVPVMQTSPIEKIERSDEEIICLEQLRRLADIAQRRELTLEETKKLDLLHKNLKLARGENTVIVSKPKKIDVPDSELITIAASQKPNEE